MRDESVHLFCFPLDTTKLICTISGLKLFQLIWLKCNYSHTFTEITVTKKDRDRIKLSHKGYERGLKDLGKINLILVEKAPGKCSLITVNTNLISGKAKEWIYQRKAPAQLVKVTA